LKNYAGALGTGGAVTIAASGTISLTQVTFSHNYDTIDNTAVYVLSSGTGGVIVRNAIYANQPQGVCVTSGQWAGLYGAMWDIVTTPVPTTAPCTGSISVINGFIGGSAFAADGYHLTKYSAAINKGSNTTATTDIDGEPRLAGKFDMGADEFYLRTFLPAVKR
jgi:hypothetical protein